MRRIKAKPTNQKLSDYENKSKEDLIKAPSESETKSEPETKPKPKAKAKPKPETKPKLEPEPELEIKFYQKKLKKLRKDFIELRHKFSNKDELGEYTKAFFNAKKYKLSKSEIEKTIKNLNKF